MQHDYQETWTCNISTDQKEVTAKLTLPSDCAADLDEQSDMAQTLVTHLLGKQFFRDEARVVRNQSNLPENNSVEVIYNAPNAAKMKLAEATLLTQLQETLTPNIPISIEHTSPTPKP